MNYFLAILLAVCTLACGGGSSSSNKSTGLNVTLDKSSLSFISLGPGVTSENVQATMTGGQGTYYLSVVSTSSNYQILATLNITSSTNGSMAFSLDPSHGFLIGNEDSTLTLALCSDPALSNKVWSTTLPVHIHIFLPNPSDVSLSSTTGGTTVSTSVSLSAVDSGGLVQATVSGSPWLTCTRTDASNFSVSANPTGLLPGTYQGTIQLSAGGASTEVPVTFSVSGTGS